MTPEQKPTMEDLMADIINKVLDQQRIVKYRPYFQKAMFAAMKQWEQISMKERDEEIKRLKEENENLGIMLNETMREIDRLNDIDQTF